MRQVSVKISVKILWVLLVMVLGSGAALAQFSSSIEGTVTDSTGAIVASAQVVLTAVDTGVTNSTETNSAGYYRFPSLGRYLQGHCHGQGLCLRHRSQHPVDRLKRQGCLPTLRPADVTASVEVQASATAVDTDEAQITSVTTERQVEELPIQGRNIYTVANQTPGVTERA